MIKDYLKAVSPMVVVFVVHEILARVFQIYEFYPRFDILMHTLGGFVTAWTMYMFYMAFHQRNLIRIEPKILLILVLIAFTGATGILWEVYEWTHDLFTVFKYQISITDTLRDLMLDMVGACLFGVIPLARK